MWIATAVESVARAAWNGDQLVAVTHRTYRITWPSNVQPEFDRQNTSREVFSLGSDGRLFVDRTVIIDPLPGGTPMRLETPTSSKCSYRRAP
jgi:hypothetical protein